MGFIFLFFILVSMVSALPDYDIEQDLVIDMNKPDLVSDPAIADNEIAQKSLIISSVIHRMVREAIENIPDPKKIDDQHFYYCLGSLKSVSGTSHGVSIIGQSSTQVKTLRVNLLNPIIPRVTYEFILSKLIINIGSINVILNINGIKVNCYIKGQVFITDSSIEGSATVNAMTKKVMSLTSIVRLGSIQSTLVGSVNGINTTSVITAIVTDVLPQFFYKYQLQINDIVANLILTMF